MHYVIVAASIFLFRLGQWCALTLYKENQVVMGIKCHAFRDVFGEKWVNGLAKASETFNISKSTLRRRALGLNKMVSPWQHLLTAIFVATTNEVVIIIL